MSGVTGYKLKVVERAGSTLKSLLWKADPTELDCWTLDCPVCQCEDNIGKTSVESQMLSMLTLVLYVSRRENRCNI